jgi:hypothetical protein
MQTKDDDIVRASQQFSVRRPSTPPTRVCLLAVYLRCQPACLPTDSPVYHVQCPFCVLRFAVPRSRLLLVAESELLLQTCPAADWRRGSEEAVCAPIALRCTSPGLDSITDLDFTHRSHCPHSPASSPRSSAYQNQHVQLTGALHAQRRR